MVDEQLQGVIACSPQFAEVFCDGFMFSSARCSCGRTHFAAGGKASLDSGEYESLLSKQQDQPEKFIEHPHDDYVSCGELFGKVFVFGCPCNYAAKLETLLWQNRHMIAEYLLARSKHEVEVANRTLKIAEELESTTKDT
jgi:hypothetical protein